jgi:hypothetical protein
LSYIKDKKYFDVIKINYICARKSCGKEVSKKELNALPGIKSLQTL